MNILLGHFVVRIIKSSANLEQPFNKIVSLSKLIKHFMDKAIWPFHHICYYNTHALLHLE